MAWIEGYIYVLSINEQIRNEALCYVSGIPVLTNDIGIEGIDAMAGRDYLHCTTADDYIQAVVNLANNEDEAKRIGMNGKEYIRENYDREKSVDSLYKRFCELL